jgi:oxygen-dependent protoporphyrinogen oxidase
MFVAPRDGMSSLVEAIASRLPAGAVRLHAPVTHLARLPPAHGGPSSSGPASSGPVWQISVGEANETLLADAVVIATPARRAASLAATFDGPLADELAAIDSAGCVVVVLGYQRADIGHRLDGFGFVVPLIEGRRILSGSFASVKYPGRAADGRVLIRVFIGGACQPELVTYDDDTLRAIAVEELADLLSIRGQPLWCRIARWPATMPQFHVGHCDRVARIEHRVAQIPGLALAGNAYHGVGVPQCIHSGETAAEGIVAFLHAAIRP